MHSTGRIGGSDVRSVGETLARVGHLLPLYPGPTVLPVVTVPSPPLLRPADSMEHRAALVARAWSGVMRHFYPVQRKYFRTPKDVHTSKNWLIWIEGAEALTEYKIAPVAWLAFSVDAVWKDYVKTERHPPVAWLLGTERMKMHERWYAGVALRYEGGRAYIPNALRELVRVYDALVSEIRALPDLTDAAVRAVVARVLPPEAYAQSIATARNESAVAERTIADLLARGEVSLWL